MQSTGTIRMHTLVKSGLIHVFKQFILFNKLLFELEQFGLDLAVLRLKPIYLQLGLHVLLVEILARLESPLWDDLGRRVFSTCAPVLSSRTDNCEWLGTFWQ